MADKAEQGIEGLGSARVLYSGLAPGDLPSLRQFDELDRLLLSYSLQRSTILTCLRNWVTGRRPASAVAGAPSSVPISSKPEIGQTNHSDAQFSQEHIRGRAGQDSRRQPGAGR